MLQEDLQYIRIQLENVLKNNTALRIEEIPRFLDILYQASRYINQQWRTSPAPEETVLFITYRDSNPHSNARVLEAIYSNNVWYDAHTYVAIPHYCVRGWMYIPYPKV